MKEKKEYFLDSGLMFESYMKKNTAGYLRLTKEVNLRHVLVKLNTIYVTPQFCHYLTKLMLFTTVH